MWDCVVANNTAAAGGGLQIDKQAGGGNVPAYFKATNCQFDDNVATGTGGGISAATCDQIVLNNVTFEGNLGAKLCQVKLP
jgi:predicted outer membrane repeat protein